MGRVATFRTRARYSYDLRCTEIGPRNNNRYRTTPTEQIRTRVERIVIIDVYYRRARTRTKRFEINDEFVVRTIVVVTRPFYDKRNSSG